MHIVLLNDDFLGPSSRGGVAVVIDGLRRWYTKIGQQVSVVTTHDESVDRTILRSHDAYGTVISLPSPPMGKDRHRRSVSITPLSAKVREAMKELQPDVVHAHNVHGYLTYDALNVAHEFTNRVYLTAQDTYLVSFGRVGGPRYERAVMENALYKLHWWNHLALAGREYWPLRNYRIRKILRSSVTRVIVYSHAMENLLHAHRITNTTFIHHAIDENDVPPSIEAIEKKRAEFGIRGPSVFFGGRIGADKGIDVLLQAMDKILHHMPQAQLVIGGDKERLAKHLTNASVRVQQSIVATDWMSLSDFRVVLGACDVATVPSVYLDALATLNIWAMAGAKPVVGTCFGGAPDIIVEGETGYIVNPRDTAQFADRLITLLKNPDLARRMGAAGAKRIAEHFSIESQVKSYLDLFKAG